MAFEPPAQETGAPDSGAPRSSIFGTITQVLNIAGTILILLVAVAVNADVGGRNIFNHPLPGVLEFVGLSIVAIVFLQMANTLREDRHVSNDILMQVLAAFHPRAAAICYSIFYLIGAFLMALIVWFVWPILVDYYNAGYYRGAANVVEVRVWPFLAAIVIGAATTSVQFLLLAWHAFARALPSDRLPR